MAARVAVLVVVIASAYRALVVSWTDLVYRRGTPAAIQEAARILPSNAVYHYTSALTLEQDDPRSPQIERAFAAAVSDDPRYSDALLAWSVEKELRGDKAGAEHLLLQARSIDHLVRPAWALANYYYRQGDIPDFLKYAHESLRMIGVSRLSEGRFNPAPIFQLFWQSGAAPADILKYGIPDVPVIRDSYLIYLLNAGHAAFAPAAAARILPYADKNDLYFLRPYMEHLITTNQMALASETWKQYFERQVVPYPGPDRATGKLITNGDLIGPPLDFGFDWRRVNPDSISFEYSRVEHSYKFTFDGTQPDEFALITQNIPVDANRSYRLIARFETDFNPENSGLRWSVRDHKSRQPIASRDAVSADGDTKVLQADFTVPASSDSIDLTLGCTRQSGTAPIRGFYLLLHADLKILFTR